MTEEKVKTKGSARQQAGFTLVELIVVIGVFVIILGSSAVVFGKVINRNSLKYYGYQLVQDLREARTNSIVQKQDSSWGMYFDDNSTPHGYTLFKGDSYVARDSAFDRHLDFPKVLYFSWVNFGGPKELIFDKSTGEPGNPGFLILTAENLDYSISINSFGIVEYEF